MNQYGQIIGRTFVSREPLVVELHFETKLIAQFVAALFHGRVVQGSVWDVGMKDDGGAVS
jgi:hypothetical protein